MRSVAVYLQLNGFRGLVVAVHEGEQGAAELVKAGEIVRRDDFLLDDGEEDLVG